MTLEQSDCLFCKISRHELPTTLRYEDELAIAFDDIHPKAPVHILIVPKKHIPTIDDVELADQSLIGHLALVAQKIAREQGVNEQGYRLIFNVRHHAGQSVDHIHLHLIGGQRLGSMI